MAPDESVGHSFKLISVEVVTTLKGFRHQRRHEKSTVASVRRGDVDLRVPSAWAHVRMTSESEHKVHKLQHIFFIQREPYTKW
uniref:Uncharacterized protein n=1 Tax=Pararge aegeria TaxID=116150 RepID=S4PE97_9NEOP